MANDSDSQPVLPEEKQALLPPQGFQEEGGLFCMGPTLEDVKKHFPKKDIALKGVNKTCLVISSGGEESSWYWRNAVVANATLKFPFF